MHTQYKILIGAVAAVALGVAVAPQTVSAGSAGAFVGGVMAAKVMRNMNERTEAEQQQAYYAQQAAQQPVQQAAPAAAAQPSAEQRIQQLDKLAAGGYITPEEYKQKKQQILDGM